MGLLKGHSSFKPRTLLYFATFGAMHWMANSFDIYKSRTVITFRYCTHRDMALEKDHKACVHFLRYPQQAFEEARRYSQERKNEELGLLFSNDSVGGAVQESTSKKRKLSSWLKTPKRKVSIVSSALCDWWLYIIMVQYCIVLC